MTTSGPMQKGICSQVPLTQVKQGAQILLAQQFPLAAKLNHVKT